MSITDSNMANLVFDLINKAEQFGDKKIDIIIINNEPWFKGKDIANILEYKKATDAIKDNVDTEDRIPLSVLLKRAPAGDGYPKFNQNQLKTIYINESGLYSLMLNSRLPAAKSFKKWVTGELLPKIRKIGEAQYLEELNKLKIENQEKENQLEEKEGLINRLHNIQIELLSFKKRVSREETIYIVSTANYARQGIFKIGKTKNAMKFRSLNHNITHIKGDKVKVLQTFKVNDCSLIERNIHTKLKGLLLEGEIEFFMCPFDLLESIVNLIVNNDDEENEACNRIIDTVFKLKQQAFNYIDWTSGIPEDIFKENMRLITSDDKEIVKFDLTEATEEQKQEFVRECIAAYKKTIRDQILWKDFQTFMIQQLNIPKYKFKPGEWRELVKLEDDEGKIKWRK